MVELTSRSGSKRTFETREESELKEDVTSIRVSFGDLVLAIDLDVVGECNRKTCGVQQKSLGKSWENPTFYHADLTTTNHNSIRHQHTITFSISEVCQHACYANPWNPQKMFQFSTTFITFIQYIFLFPKNVSNGISSKLEKNCRS